eukprot:22666-Pyramimonas_sp.AAC.1
MVVLHFTSLQCALLHFTSLHFTSLQCVLLHFTSLHFTAHVMFIHFFAFRCGHTTGGVPSAQQGAPSTGACALASSNIAISNISQHTGGDTYIC